MTCWLHHLFNVLCDEVRKLKKNPDHLWRIFRKGTLNKNLDRLWVMLKYHRKWAYQAGLRAKQYHSYEDYLAHQPTKRRFLDDRERNRNIRVALSVRVADLPIWDKGKTVLCLAAGSGGEVRAFLDLGCFAVGIDLYPKSNPYVLYGDFQNIQFPNESVDIVYTNSLDHAFDIPKIIREIKRVLRPNGYMVLEIVQGSSGGQEPGFWESMWWDEIDDVIDLFIEQGFKKMTQRPYGFLKNQVCLQMIKG